MEKTPKFNTASMIGATALAAFIRENSPQYPICFVGSHTSALPRHVLTYQFVDFVLLF